jgi:hypothetical protein
MDHRTRALCAKVPRRRRGHRAGPGADQPSSNAPGSHSMRSPSMATTSKRQGGGTPGASGSAAPRAPAAAACARRRWRRRRRGRASRARAHLDEDQRAVAVAQDQVDLAAARRGPARDPIIALHQPQAARLQPGPGRGLGRVAELLAPAAGRRSAPLTLPPALPCLNIRLPAAAGRREAAGHQQPRRRTVRGGHADRQPGRPDAARGARAGRSTPWPARTRAWRRSCCATWAATSRCWRCTPTTSTRAAACWRAGAAASAVAFVSDAGTPACQRPRRACWWRAARGGRPGTAWCRCPGASSALAALSVAGDVRRRGRASLRRLPAGQGGERRSALQAVLADARHAGAVRGAAPHRALAARWPRRARRAR